MFTTSAAGRPRRRTRRAVEARTGDAHHRRAAYKLVGTSATDHAARRLNVNGWNQYHIIARGPVLMQLINGQLMAVAIDEDTKNAVAEGLIGFQMHVGPPFKIRTETSCCASCRCDGFPRCRRITRDGRYTDGNWPQCACSCVSSPYGFCRLRQEGRFSRTC